MIEVSKIRICSRTSSRDWNKSYFYHYCGDQLILEATVLQESFDHPLFEDN